VKTERMPATITIGDFSEITHLSVKTLRHYHEVGLLEPSSVDPRTGYRSYTLDQVPTAQVVLRFRELGMPVREVAALLEAAPAERADLITSHLERLEVQLASTQRSVTSLRRLLAPDRPPLDVQFRSEPPTLVAAIQADVERRDVAAWWLGALAELRAALTGELLVANGPPGGVYDSALFADDRGRAIVYLATDTPPTTGRVTPMTLPAAELAVAVHDGPHDDMDVTYGALGTYVTEHEIAISGPVHERYLIGPTDTEDRATWRTEIGWPVFRATPVS
jgi:DNA-binding transcriptional MerR regulator/effector-binding domain-containing protein